MSSGPLVVIPARLESARLPAKMLRRMGARSLIEWTWVAACRAGYPVIIATDSHQIEREAKTFGARVVLTGPAGNGTERCALALALIGETPEIVINWQGDTPLTPAWVARALARALADEPFAVATPVRLAERSEPSQVSVAVAPDGRALYFTRQLVPPSGPWWFHLGLYAYRAKALAHYGLAATPLEAGEQLEQNRWLELGVGVKAVPVETGPVPEVNETRDLANVAEALGCCQ